MSVPIAAHHMIATDRLDAEVSSAVRSLISGFPSLHRALESTQRFMDIDTSKLKLGQVTPTTKGRLMLMFGLHHVLAEYERLGVPGATIMHDIPLLVQSIRSADQQIRSGHDFTGFS